MGRISNSTHRQCSRLRKRHRVGADAAAERLTTDDENDMALNLDEV